MILLKWNFHRVKWNVFNIVIFIHGYYICLYLTHRLYLFSSLRTISSSSGLSQYFKLLDNFFWDIYQILYLEQTPIPPSPFKIKNSAGCKRLPLILKIQKVIIAAGNFTEILESFSHYCGLVAVIDLMPTDQGEGHNCDTAWRGWHGGKIISALGKEIWRESMFNTTGTRKRSIPYANMYKVMWRTSWSHGDAHIQAGG